MPAFHSPGRSCVDKKTEQYNNGISWTNITKPPLHKEEIRNLNAINITKYDGYV